MTSVFIVKKPVSDDEMTQLYALNYATFVEEIPQHAERVDRKLIDKFQNKNHYIIAKVDEEVVAMVSYNTERPFSLDQKGVDLSQQINSSIIPAEVRLLSVKPAYRKTTVLFRLLRNLISELVKKGFNKGFISATTREMDLYEKMGFIAFGELVGKEGSYYQPMMITLDNLKPSLRP